jgi:hypothetical protein
MLYVGYIIARFAEKGFLVRLVNSHRLHLMTEDKDDCFEVEVPPPPDYWLS